MKFKSLHKNAVLPVRSTPGSAGLDVHTTIENPIVIPPGRRATFPTGLALDIPVGFEVQVRSRSGLALKHGVIVLNSPGTIDSDFRGELKVILYNSDSEESYMVSPGERIAQLVYARYEHVSPQWTQTVSETSRNESGFGSTGQLLIEPENATVNRVIESVLGSIDASYSIESVRRVEKPNPHFQVDTFNGHSRVTYSVNANGTILGAFEDSKSQS